MVILLNVSVVELSFQIGLSVRRLGSMEMGEPDSQSQLRLKGSCFRCLSRDSGFYEDALSGIELQETFFKP